MDVYLARLFRMIYELLMLLVIVGITKIHADRFAHNRYVSPTFHFLWAAVYLLPCLVIAVLSASVWLLIALLMVRFVFYNVILNVWRTRPFFYIHSGVNGSWWDDIELKWSGAYPYLWA